jgi:hypothetical protein
MATTETRTRLAPILQQVATEFRRRQVDIGDTSKAPATLRVEREENVKRIVQVYWTPFQAEIMDESVGLHLEIDQPKVHWVEGYISPTVGSWIFAFHERADGDYQLAYYQQHQDPNDAVHAFFEIAEWYALTPTDLTWPQVKAKVDESLGWAGELEAQASSGAELDKAINEALKKSTIVWLRWNESGTARTMPVWFVQDAKVAPDKLFVLSGERQQTVPNADKLRDLEVIVRWKGNNAQVAELPADLRVVPQGEEWDTLAEKLAEKRLNIPGLPEETARRWRAECQILELTLR